MSTDMLEKKLKQANKNTPSTRVKERSKHSHAGRREVHTHFAVLNCDVSPSGNARREAQPRPTFNLLPEIKRKRRRVGAVDRVNGNGSEFLHCFDARLQLRAARNWRNVRA